MTDPCGRGTRRGGATRRDFLRAAAAALGAGVLKARGAGDEVTIALFTDSHYADRTPRGSRHYRDSIPKLAQCIEAMGEAKPDVAVVLGDFTDQRGGVPAKLADLQHIEALYRKLQVPRHHVIGNHDVDCISKAQFVAGTAMPAPHYAFDAGPLRGIVLDANYNKDLSPYNAGNFTWTETYVPPAEQRWLKAQLAAAKGKAVVFIHQCLDDEKGSHGVKNAPDVRKVLEASGKVLAVFQGHNHRGAFRRIGGIPYFTLRAMVEGPGLANNAYALATLSPDGGVALRGFAKQPSPPACGSLTMGRGELCGVVLRGLRDRPARRPGSCHRG